MRRTIGLPALVVGMACCVALTTTGDTTERSQNLPPQPRVVFVKAMQRRIMETANFIQGLWSSRVVVHNARLQNYVAHPSHYTNQRRQDVWLAK
jgi:hypothetical protein